MNSKLAKRAARGRRQQKGNALLFALLGLVIAGIVVAIGISQYQESEKSASVQDTVGQVNQIIGKVKENFGQYAYNGLTTAIAVGGNVIPSTLAISSTTAAAKFGGAIDLVDNNSTTPSTSLLTYATVPSDMCVAIVNGTQALSRRVQVAGTDVKPLDGTINPATLTSQCISSTAVAVAWTVGRT